MGSIVANECTNRLLEAVSVLCLSQLAERFNGKTIERIEVEAADGYRIRMNFHFTDGSSVDGPVLAEYIDAYFGDEDIDGCVIHDETPASRQALVDYYQKKGWEEHI